MNDNKTSQPAQMYDSKIEKTMPHHSLFIEQAFDLIDVARPNPVTWLDAGCGTGILVSRAAKRYAGTSFVLADPSEAMLSVSREKFSGNPDVKLEFLEVGTEDLTCPSGSFDVITAIISHHYFDENTKRKVAENCFRMLKDGGIYVNFETIKPQTDKGTQLGLKRWGLAQLRGGKSEKEVEGHLSRYGKSVLPISLESHINLLNDVGFSTAEVFWLSFMQAGFYAIK